ncbi:MAG: hypothetical protein ACOYU0_00470 [Nitrospirota bacterium]
MSPDTIYSNLVGFFGNKPAGKILDVPPEKGDLAEELLKQGFSDITCIDVDPEGFKLKGRVNFLNAISTLLSLFRPKLLIMYFQEKE